MDEHFRRSLGANYESLFKKKTSTGDSESSSTSSTSINSNESTPPKTVVPDQVVVNNTNNIEKSLNRSDSKTKESPNCSGSSSSNLDNNKVDSTKVDDPVKAFQEEEMEGYTGRSTYYSRTLKTIYNVINLA